ncbi:hypothetical protein [Cryptosporangium minutisporangium]|uniref:Uncharacterized protein n=1 Tax=Cryptosporangium minutisporangium TaxID=113569 RepID=A0ABP6T6H9_9ACTN
MVFRRKKASTRDLASAKAKEIGTEVGAGVEHFRNAAVATAGAARDAVKPAVGSARDALGPKVDAARVAVAPKVEAARVVVAPKLESALEQAREAVSPRVESARDSVVSTAKPKVDQLLVALAPLVAAAIDAQQTSKKQVKKSAKKFEKQTRSQRREAAKRAKETSLALRGQRRRRWPWMLGALAAGTAVGAGAALAARRNRQPEWEEYDLVEPDTRSTVKEKADQVAERVSSAATSAKEAVSSTGDKTAKDKTTPIPGAVEPTTETTASSVKDAAEANSRRS